MSDLIRPSTYPMWARALRIGFSIYVSLIAGMISIGFFVGQHTNSEDHILHQIAHSFAILYFRAGYLYNYFIAAFVALIALEFLARRRGGFSFALHTALFTMFCTGALTGYLNPYVGGLFVVLLCYWLLVGRVAGRPGWQFHGFWRSSWAEIAYVACAALLIVPPIWRTAELQVYGLLPDAPGTPPFLLQYDRENTASLNYALRRFPDAQSCLVRGADAGKRDDLVQMDWTEVRSAEQAQVCLFRLLHAWGTVADAQSWLEAQGFTVNPNSFNSTNPYRDQNGELHVNGNWDIRQNGPKFPAYGILQRLNCAFSYSMWANAKFDETGQTLVSVNLGFNTL